EYFIGVN
nr:RecName: Full=42 kDa cell wall protein [Arabidopsis thaliana]